MNIDIDRKTGYAVVALLWAGSMLWPIGAASLPELVFFALLAPLVILLGLSRAARNHRLVIGLLGCWFVCYGGYLLLRTESVVIVVGGVLFLGIGVLTVLNQTGIAPWSDHESIR